MTATIPETGDIPLGDIGRCIYCGATEGLGTEHLIPLSLGGRHVLRRASCKACERATNRWETKISRGSFLPFRTILGMPTRRPAERPTSFPAKVMRGEEWSEENLDLTQYTAVAPFPKLPEPGAIAGRPLTDKVQTHGAIGITVIANDGRDRHPARRAGVDAIETAIAYEPVAWMRMMAKIGWGFTVAQYGLDAVEPAIVGAILGTDHNVAHYVGMLNGWTLFDGPAESDLQVCVAVIQDGRVLSGIRLFSHQGAPEYVVVVGRLCSAIEAEEAAIVATPTPA